MSYLPVPAASGDNLSGTKNQIRDNFTKIKTDFAVNHVGFDLTDEGKHKFLQLPEQASAPTTAANEAGLYTKVANSITELFMRREGDGNEIQLTTGEVVAASSGYTFLPGGLIMQWGISAASSATTKDITFSDSNIAFPNNLFNVQLTPNRATSSPGSTFQFYLSTAGFSKTGFTIVNRTTHSYAFQWVALGN